MIQYKRSELGKRTAIFACAAYVGTMFGGYIQSGVKASLDGVHGLESWRWVRAVLCDQVFVANRTRFSSLTV